MDDKEKGSPIIEKSFIDGYEYMVVYTRREHYCAYVGVPSTHWIYGQRVDRWWDTCPSCPQYGGRDYPDCGEITYSGEYYSDCSHRKSVHLKLNGNKAKAGWSKLWYLGWDYMSMSRNHHSPHIPSRERYMEDIQECVKWLKRIEREEEFVDWKNDEAIIL